MFQQTRFNKTYTGNLENARRLAWERNLVEIYKHNLMAAAGHHGYTLRDNHMADFSTRQYNQEMVSNRCNRISMIDRSPRDRVEIVASAKAGR